MELYTKKQLESFYKELSTFNFNNVKYTSWDECEKEFLRNLDLPFCFCKKEHIKSADVLVGFYSDEKITFELDVGGVTTVTHTLEPGQFVFAFNNTVLPTVAIQFCHVTVSKPVTCIVAYLNTSLRKLFCLNSISIDNDRIQYGKIYPGWKGGAIVLPKFHYHGNQVEHMKEIQKEALERLIKKSADYGDAFQTYGLIGVLVRIQDKIVSISKTDDSDTIREILMDLNIFSAMGLMMS